MRRYGAFEVTRGQGSVLEQDPAATLRWLAREVGRWQRRHAARGARDEACVWWAARAARTRQLLRESGAAVIPR